MRTHLRWLMLALCLVVALPLAAGCQRSPVTGEQRLMFLSPEQEVALGKEAEPQVVQELGGVYNDPALTAYVREVGGRVAAQAANPDLPYQYTFGIVDNDQVNAFALPGGPIYVTKGLLFNLQNEAQLAAVLAHEVTHVAGQHTAEAVSDDIGLAVVLEAAVAAISHTQGGTAGERVGLVADVARGIRQLSYSREHEREADIYGLQYLVQAGYQPQAMVEVMQLFEQMGGGGIEFLQTHPNPGNRMEYLQEEIRTKYPQAAQDSSLIVGRERYQERVLSRRGAAAQPR